MKQAMSLSCLKSHQWLCNMLRIKSLLLTQDLGGSAHLPWLAL
jgi:hypothetical protein